MKNTQNIASLIAKLEYEVGRECYNPNSYDGYTGIEGLGYRYPVKVYQNENMRTYIERCTILGGSFRNGVIDFDGEERKAEVHWFQEETVGKVKFKVKRWIDED